MPFLNRSEKGNYAVYSQPTEVAPGVFRKKRAETIVGKESPQDQSIQAVPDEEKQSMYTRYAQILKNTKNQATQ